MSDPSKCVILVPVAQSIVPECECGLIELQRRGYDVRRALGYSQIDLARSEIATAALDDGYDETMWIDSDIAFDPDSVELLRRHNMPISCGIYAKKGKQQLAIHALPGTQEIIFGDGGGLLEILYAATGFLHVRREVYENIKSRLDLPVCNQRFKKRIVPFFRPLVIADEEDSWYLSEDYSFCERARQCGYKVYADSRIRLFHIGNYGYGWEEAGGAFRKLDRCRFRLTDGQSHSGG